MVDLKLQIPDDFFEEEERCDYLISKEMKEVWAVELDLMAELFRVCKKHNIKIMASGGTMLGAVRHKGFIPWDDDIDLMMFREDYEKLCSVSYEFKHPYFFQTPYTDKGYTVGHAKLRNSETTAILTKYAEYIYPYNQGIFIDIFPLDSVTDNKLLRFIQAKQASFFKHMVRRAANVSVRYVVGKSKKRYYPLYKFFYKQFESLSLKCYIKYEKICKRYNHVNTEMVSTLSFKFENQQHYKYRRDYIETIDLPFEFMTVPVGKEYDEGLRKRYGNYKEYVIGNSCHGGVIFDTDKAYTTYLNDMKEKFKSKTEG